MHKRHQRPKLQPKDDEKERYIPSDHRVIVLARGTGILVGVGTDLGRHTFGGSTSSRSANNRPVFEEGVNQTRAMGTLNQAAGTRTPCLRNNHPRYCCERFFCISSTSYVAKRLPTHDWPHLLYC